MPAPWDMFKNVYKQVFRYETAFARTIGKGGRKNAAVGRYSRRVMNEQERASLSRPSA